MSKPSARSGTEPGGLAPPALLKALSTLLRPLVRLLIANQITFPLLGRLLRGVFVEVAEQELRREGVSPSDSRISLLTGIHRKELKRQRESASETTPASSTASLGARLVLQWTAAPEFQDGRGRPRALPRSGSEPSFESLVASVSTDIRPRAVLDEWLRLGVVGLDYRGRVRLVSGAFVPTRGFDEKAHFFGRNLADHIASAAHNLSGGEPLLERSVYYDALSEDSVRELRALAEKAGMDVLQKVNKRALALQRRDAKSGAGGLRMTFGTWFFRTWPEPESSDDED